MANVWCEPALPWGPAVKKGRVCWRDGWTEDSDGEMRRPKRSVTVTGAAARDELLVKVRRALDVDGHYVHRPPAEQRIANLELAAAAWIRHKASRGAARGTVLALTSGWTRISRDVRALERIAPARVIPVTLLSRALVTRLLDSWARQGLSSQRRYDLTLYLYGAWVWASDDPMEWPGTPAAPRDASAVLPPPPARGLAPDAPTLEEVDAICQRAAAHSPDLRDIVACLRLTGLRIGQVMALRVGDVRRREQTLIVRTGKSAREKADQREIPVHRTLLSLLDERLRDRPADAFLFPSPRGGAGPRHRPTLAVRQLWIDAAGDNEVREHVWKPRNRGKARPDHAFRAAFLAALAALGAPEDVRRALVGHAPGTTEGRAYCMPSAGRLREHLDRVPQIDWGGPLSRQGAATG